MVMHSFPQRSGFPFGARGMATQLPHSFNPLSFLAVSTRRCFPTVHRHTTIARRCGGARCCWRPAARRWLVAGSAPWFCAVWLAWRVFGAGGAGAGVWGQDFCPFRCPRARRGRVVRRRRVGRFGVEGGYGAWGGVGVLWRSFARARVAEPNVACRSSSLCVPPAPPLPAPNSLLPSHLAWRGELRAPISNK